VAGVTALVLLSSMAGGFVGERLARADGTARSSASPVTAPLVRDAGGGTATTLDVQAVLAAVEGAVVDIQATGPRQSGQGTGIVYSADGLVLTNAHVVEGATQVTVTTPGDRQARAATVVGADTTRDVAVLRLQDTSNLVVAQLGESGDVKVGQDVVAIGNALGLRGDPSVTRGIVSALDRSIGDLTGLLQTDAAINSGNSGGPLVNAAGQVIGINTAIAVENNAQNIGFAIPIDDARAVATRIVNGSPATASGYLGVATTDNDEATTGATIAEVSAGSAAAAAGLRAGDVVVAVDGSTVSGAASLSRLVGSHQPGDKVELTILRDGREQKLTATLGSK
jgi:putative serine protease PepD